MELRASGSAGAAPNLGAPQAAGAAAGPINDNILKIAKTVKRFLCTVDAQAIGAGGVVYDRDEFLFIAQMSYWWPKRLAVDTKVEKLIEALMELTAKINKIAEAIKQCQPGGGQDVKLATRLINYMVKFQLVFEGTASKGFDCLSANYGRDGNHQNSGSISTYKSKVYTLIKECTDTLASKLKPFVPELEQMLNVESYGLKARRLVLNWSRYRDNLRKVTSDRAGRLQLPLELIQDRIEDSMVRPKLNRDALRIAAKFFALPTMAAAIPGLPATGDWQPWRIWQDDTGKIVFQPAVYGTCERIKGDHPTNICNLYVRGNSDLLYGISCGAIDTKAEQLAVVMKRIRELVPKMNGRWAFLQLNSLWKEAALVEGTHIRFYLNEPFFNQQLGTTDTSFLHFNTCFNYASTLYNEDRQALITINIDSLALLADYMQQDFATFLKTNFAQSVDVQTFFKECGQLASFASDLKTLKRKIKDNSDPSKAKENDSLRKELQQKQTELEKKLREFRDTVWQLTSLSFSAMDGSIGESNELKRMILVLHVYEKLLSAQLQIKPLSRTSEVELLLLIFRLLEIKAVIICLSGLDRSGMVRAIGMAQEQLEWEIFTSLLRDPTKREEVKVEARSKLFQFLCDFEENRNLTFTMQNEIISSLKKGKDYAVDLNEVANMAEPATSIRERLEKAIDEKYPLAKGTKGQDLKWTLRYLDLIGELLARSEMEKTLMSTGAVGLSYHQDAGFPNYLFANFHALERLPMFCYVGKKAIQLLQAAPGSGSAVKLNMTVACMFLYLGLSQLRGD